MSFDVFLIDVHDRIAAEDWPAMRDAALASVGAHYDKACIFLSDGRLIELFGDGPSYILALRDDLDLAICEAIFSLADAGKLFVSTEHLPNGFARTPKNREPIPEETFEIPDIPITTADELLRHLTGGFETWRSYRDQALGGSDKE